MITPGKTSGRGEKTTMEWQQLFGSQNEKPLEHLVSDGGYCGIFRTIACIGDSLASGEFESIDDEGKKHYHDFFDYSWGQYLGRMCGSKVYNFSRGGMTAKWYCETFADEKGYWSPDLAAQAYLVALGVNDLHNRPDVVEGREPLGSVDQLDLSDWRNNPKNFAGYYATIIQRYREIQPRAPFFLLTFPDHPRSGAHTAEHHRVDEEHRALLCDLAKVFPDTYVIDLLRFGPTYDEKFRETFFSGSHMNPMGYVFTARVVASYIDWIIRQQPEKFREAGFIGTPYRLARDGQ